jgi:ABC-2 type transport system permease protein
MKPSADNMKKTIKVFLKLIDMNIKTVLTYRASLLVSLISNALFVLAYIVFIEVLFLHIPKLGSLGKGETLMVMAFFYLFHNIMDMIYRDNFERFSEDTRRGLLDNWITKPVPSRLMTFCHTMRFDYLPALIITGMQFWYASQWIQKPIETSFFIAGLAVTFISVWLMFQIFSIIATWTFWIEKNDTLWNISWNMMQMGRYPESMYTGLAKKILTSIIPLALIANIPAEIALKTVSSESILLFTIVSVVMYGISIIFWNMGIKRYASAG